jgi:hypothetical protein
MVSVEEKLNNLIHSNLFMNICESIERGTINSFVYNKNYQRDHDQGADDDFHMEPVQVLLYIAKLFGEMDKINLRV